MHFFVSLVSIFIFGIAQAEYRAFELSIENVETGKDRKVVSTLDPVQYAQYYPVQPGEIVKYVTSWMCWENTGNRPICQRLPSSVAP